MTGLIFHLALATLTAGAPANPVLNELLDKGVAMPDGSAVQLPAPVVTEEMDAAAQAQAIAKVAAPNNTFETFTQKSSSAPIVVKIRTLKGQGKDAAFRAVDLWFVAHGDWDTLVSDKFADSLVKTKEREKSEQSSGGALLKSGFLTDEEMQKRGLANKSKDGQEDRYFYTTFMLFDRVEIAATRYAVLTKRPASVLLAAQVDPQFAKDAEYPNQWRSIDRDAAAKLVYGPKRVYSGAGFYIRVTRLARPANTVFVEYHSVFHEPYGWFDGENLLRAKVPTIAQHEVKQFRARWAKASAEKGE